MEKKIKENEIMTVKKLKKLMRLKQIRNEKNIIKLVNSKKNELRKLSDTFKKDFKDVEMKQLEFEDTFLNFNVIIILLFIVLFIYLFY